MRLAYDVTKKIDPTRPVNETSGYQHQKTDIWTVHHYEPKPEKLNASFKSKKVFIEIFQSLKQVIKINLILLMNMVELGGCQNN